ncbi:MAG: SUMF1/EgtB/PvdO family nonheme iron enzyme, partial [Acidobacteriota bacterium]
TDVAFADAEAFLTQLSVRETGVSYRLPTADEWEFAARAESETRFIFGDEPTELHRYGNCENILEQDGFDGPAPVGTYQPNAWGLYDVHGNVAEWVQWPEGEEPSEDEEGNKLALRLGGSFESATSSCAFAHRSIVQAGNTSRQETGFRIVREIVSSEDEE